MTLSGRDQWEWSEGVTSSSLIVEGRYKQVNSIGVATIVSAVNAVKPIVIPYLFGGEGATILLPAS